MKKRKKRSGDEKRGEVGDAIFVKDKRSEKMQCMAWEGEWMKKRKKGSGDERRGEVGDTISVKDRKSEKMQCMA